MYELGFPEITELQIKTASAVSSHVTMGLIGLAPKGSKQSEANDGLFPFGTKPLTKTM